MLLLNVVDFNRVPLLLAPIFREPSERSALVQLQRNHSLNKFSNNSWHSIGVSDEKEKEKKREREEREEKGKTENEQTAPETLSNPLQNNNWKETEKKGKERDM